MPEMHGCEKYTSKNTLNSSEKTLNDLVLTEDATISDVKPTEVVNLKDGDTYDLTIQKVRKVINGKTLIMLSYNGSIPWPTFRAPKGATVKFKVRNTVRELATTIHPHGVRLNYLYDGVPRDQGGAQDPIKVGDVYEQIIKFPDTGIFWYHPHTRDDFEQELGEYGTFQIYDPKEKQTVDSENVITLDDILIEKWVIAPFETETVNHTLMGRYGNTMLVNGSTNFSLTLKQGEVKRLYLVNTANARPFDFAIPWIKMKLVGGDNSYYQNEAHIDHLVIAPAERYIVDIMSEKSGEFPMQSIGGGKVIPLGIITVIANTIPSIYQKDFETLKTYDVLGTLKNTLSSYQSKAPDKSLKITMTMEGMEWMENMGGMNHNMDSMSWMGMGGMSMWNESPDGIEWEDTMVMMNANSTNKTVKWILRDEETLKEGMDIDWKLKKWSIVKIRLTNDKDAMHPMQHPFHMHGQRFLILNQNWTVNTNFVWKDTVLIPKDQYVDILVDMSNPWNWMAHCHIVEHLFSGMMFGYVVEN
jgi:FtsP/CotA-like multicopper oxidase with cupredoxin domain